MRRLVPVLPVTLALALAAAPARAASEGDDAPWLVGGQATLVGLLVPGLRSPYGDPALSFGGATGHAGWSSVVTLFGGLRLWEGATAVVEPEYANGSGVPNVSGISGYPDANMIRVVRVGASPYVARAFLHQDLALGPREEGPAPAADAPESRFAPTGPLALRRARPASRVEVTVGKFALNDFFDAASASGDPRHRFMNWALMTNGAWDFAADTRGYTWGAAVGLEQPRFAVRAAVALMPTVPNGPELDGDLAHARSEVVELEWRHDLLGRPGAVKLLGFLNHARMGSYAAALAAGAGGVPSLDGTRRRGATKYGLGLLVDQQAGPASVFLRASFDDGANETFAFTEIDRAVSGGAELPGALWGRAGDRVGLAVAASGLSADHAAYLARGGKGFQLGDGRLSYAWEVVAEGYYALRVTEQAELSADVQGIWNPGMNADRGPALALAGRLHLHF
ncbi:carbohydrate porin [Anaeromyxobacter paludicola]|uniref:Porin n=1 Tax=Anaeromyxobacter paludicola TaxID=2918171 RepID=A0ABN6N6M3_9BACT|nr:carbohydrate porin [Anaeromyxobacter paludicola]BDG08829.1 hypothetical protein AMPC_19420 [Anaeromyxobacter paludicola]